MRSDLLKTIAGLVIIGLIVVATFMYGNAQREAQLKRDQDLKRAQEAQASASPAVATSPTPTQVAVATTKPTPTPTKTPVASATPTATPAPTPLPQTGAEDLIPAVAAGAMGIAGVAWRRSQRSLLQAAKTRHNG